MAINPGIGHKTCFYIGVTGNLELRIIQHKNGENDGFSKKYFVHRLVYYETINDINAAIEREKCLKRWKREWKIKLIESENPDWEDLAKDWV